MIYSKQELWERFKKYYIEFPTLGLAIDLSRMHVSDDYFASMETRMQAAFAQMSDLEAGAIANPDEGRMVGHYWLRNPALAPTPEIRGEIEETLVRIKAFAADVHSGVVCGAGGTFKNLLIIGIGGSALGPQFVLQALRHPRGDKMRTFFFDNTDPDGMERVLAEIGPELGRTLCVVISKSGATKETRNGMLEAKTAFELLGFEFGRHAVAITRTGSELDGNATSNAWLARFPMWDWVGGRTSELSAVGLLPAALQGFDIESIICGAKACDEICRQPHTLHNPAALLALSWFHAGSGAGNRNMVVLPYKDRLDLLGKYLQQLIMESIGKRINLAGRKVNQGLTVFGNKGSTDQHSYIQQLRDGRDDFFVTFVEVLKDHDHHPLFIEPRLTSGDYLHGLFLGTREALAEDGRLSLTITMLAVSAFSIGALLALFERTVGLYASLIDVNAYHQPGVEAGKKAATAILSLQLKVQEFVERNPRIWFTADEIALQIGFPSEVEHVFKVCEHLSANHSRGVVKMMSWSPKDYLCARYRAA
jgi:glucose-6-phosphate isomerase